MLNLLPEGVRKIHFPFPPLLPFPPTKNKKQKTVAFK